MSSEIISALISLTGAALGTLTGIIINSKLTSYRLEQLEKKVDKHNNLVERTYIIEQRLAVSEETQRTAERRISDLEAKSFTRLKGV